MANYSALYAEFLTIFPKYNVKIYRIINNQKVHLKQSKTL